MRRDVEQRARAEQRGVHRRRRRSTRRRAGRTRACENSNSSSSIASTTAASGVPKVADMPAAAPHARRILRSDGVTRMSLADERAERAAGDDDRAFGAERSAGADGDRRRQRLGDARSAVRSGSAW